MGKGAVKQPPKKVEIESKEPTNATFILRGEDHTLGNALRYVLMKNRDVAFCGYSIPHPSEDIMNIQVKTTGKPATEVFQTALEDLRAMFAHVKKAYTEEVENFDEANADIS